MFENILQLLILQVCIVTIVVNIYIHTLNTFHLKVQLNCHMILVNVVHDFTKKKGHGVILFL